jgi:hypothetical protein
MRTRGSSIILAATALASLAAADVALVPSAKDNTLYEDPNGAFSNGAGAYMFCGETIGFGSRRALVAFDVDAYVPAGAIINSVTLRLYCSRASTGTRRIELHHVSQDWGEGASNAGEPGGSGDISQPGDATWIHTFYNTQFWTTPGGDFSPTSSGDRTVGVIGSYTWGSTAGMVADVQGWLDNPSSNFGWLMLGLEDQGRSAKRFDTREIPDADKQPLLTVNYTIPEPTTLAPLVGGAFLLLRRRR